LTWRQAARSCPSSARVVVVVVDLASFSFCVRHSSNKQARAFLFSAAKMEDTNVDKIKDISNEMWTQYVDKQHDLALFLLSHRVSGKVYAWIDEHCDQLHELYVSTKAFCEKGGFPIMEDLGFVAFCVIIAKMSHIGVYFTDANRRKSQSKVVLK
jgi:hypothetical protein